MEDIQIHHFIEFAKIIFFKVEKLINQKWVLQIIKYLKMKLKIISNMISIFV